MSLSLGGIVTAAQESKSAAPVDTKAQLLPILSTAPRKDVAPPTGLLPTALAEARVAATHAALALKTEDLAELHQYATDVLHAIDPSLASSPTGQGAGVRPTVQAIVQQLSLVAVPNATEDVRRLTPGAQMAAANVLTWCDALVSTATAIRNAKTVADAKALTPALTTISTQIITGVAGPSTRGTPMPRGEGGLLTLQASVSLLVASREAQARAVPSAPPSASMPTRQSAPVLPPVLPRFTQSSETQR